MDGSVCQFLLTLDLFFILWLDWFGFIVFGQAVHFMIDWPQQTVFSS